VQASGLLAAIKKLLRVSKLYPPKRPSAQRFLGFQDFAPVQVLIKLVDGGHFSTEDFHMFDPDFVELGSEFVESHTLILPRVW